MSPRAYDVLFLLVPLLFVLQMALGAVMDEPYPALLMPGFSGTAERDGTTLLYRTVIQVQGRDLTVSLSPQLLFAQAPPSHTGSLLRWFRPATLGTEPGRMGQQLGHWIPGYPRRRAWHAIERSPELDHWLVERVQTLLPDKVIHTIAIERHKHLFHPATGMQEGQLVSRLAIELP